MRRLYPGFSLLELMIVLAIIGITASLAYPRYNNFITNMRRKDGQTALLDLVIRMERYYLKHHTYETATLGQGLPSDILGSTLSPGHWYQLSIAHGNKTSYVLQAKPIGQQAKQDLLCPSLTINHLGEKKTLEIASRTPLTSCW